MRFILVLSCLALVDLSTAQSTIKSPSNKFFDGIYGGLGLGSQNIFGGSFVNEMDVLAQESRFVLELSSGYRKQFLKNRLLAGVEFQLGFTNGDLKHTDPTEQLTISYENNTQAGFGLTMGVVLGSKKNYLVFLYGNETTRKFDVTITDSGGSYQQTDEQGMLKYGFGGEVRIYKKLNMRATIGALRVDFGDLVTNIDVEDKLDIMAGVVYQF